MPPVDATQAEQGAVEGKPQALAFLCVLVVVGEGNQLGRCSSSSPSVVPKSKPHWFLISQSSKLHPLPGLVRGTRLPAGPWKAHGLVLAADDAAAACLKPLLVPSLT